VALERLKGRGRGEEHLISLDYIRRLHELHEDWLVEGRWPLPAPQVPSRLLLLLVLDLVLIRPPSPVQVIVVDANQGMEEMEAEFRRQERNLFGPEKENDSTDANKENDANEQNKDARMPKRASLDEEAEPQRQLLKLSRDN
jgi:hypothetical protein